MANKTSLLKLSEIEITPKISIRIPTVGEVLDNEQAYYNLASSLTSSPFSFMVQLADMGRDYTQISDWELFMLLFRSYVIQQREVLQEILNEEQLHKIGKMDKTECVDYIEGLPEIKQLREATGINMVFGNLSIFGFDVVTDKKDGERCLYNPWTDTEINRVVYIDIANTIRKINLFERNKNKPGNEAAKKYLLEKERRRLKANAKKTVQTVFGKYGRCIGKHKRILVYIRGMYEFKSILL